MRLTINLLEGWFLWSIDTCVTDLPSEVCVEMNEELEKISYGIYSRMGYPFHINYPTHPHLYMDVLEGL
jgi:hypothetical protein